MLSNVKIIILVAIGVIFLCLSRKYQHQSVEYFLNANNPKYHDCNGIVRMMKNNDKRTKKFSRLSKNTTTILKTLKPDIQEILRKDGSIDRSIQSRCIIPNSQMERFKLIQVVNPVNEDIMCRTNVTPDMKLPEVTFPYETNRGCIIDLKSYSSSTLESDMNTLYKIDKLAYKEINDDLTSSYNFVNNERNGSVNIYNDLYNRVLPKAQAEENSWKIKNNELNNDFNTLLNENKILNENITQRETRRVLEPGQYKSKPPNVGKKRNKENDASKFVNKVSNKIVNKVSKIGNKVLSKLKIKR
jgi:hypothetical protein